MAAKGRNTKKRWVDPDDAPVLTGLEVDLPNAKWRIGGRDVPPIEGKKAFRDALIGKTRINIHLDNDVLAYFRQQAGERGYQTLINQALRRAISVETENLNLQLIKDDIRQLKEEVRKLREEANSYFGQIQFDRTSSILEQLQAPSAPPLGFGYIAPRTPALTGAGATFAGYGQLAQVA